MTHSREANNISDHIEPELLKLKRRKEKESAILIAVETYDNSAYFEDVYQELFALAYSAGSDITDTVIQKRNKYDPATLIGQGKIEEIRKLVEEKKPDLVIFLNDLKPSQERNITKALNVKVIDRQALILDIFAQRAQTKEGKMQVELALLNYLLPRLAGLGQVLSRLGGGIGTRGPGETMLETDKRHVRRRIQTLNQELKKLKSHRGLLRESRYNKGFLTASIVGYTNSGKSTILNLMTDQDVTVQDKLFATLHTTVGKVFLREGLEILLVDTVGFIRHLPHQLAAAFRATLEEVQESDIIIRVIDASKNSWEEHKEVTEQVLEDIGCDNKPTIVLFNKSDLLPEEKKLEIKSVYPDALFVSALNNEGFDRVKDMVASIAVQYYGDYLERFNKHKDYWTRSFTTEKTGQ